MNSILKTKDLVFKEMIHYGDIDVLEKKVTFIKGKSGCGKTTLLRLFNGIISPSSGDIFYQGKSILTYNPIELRKEVLGVNQETFLFNDTIEGNFKTYYSCRDEEAPNEKVMGKFLSLCGGGDFPLDKDCLVMSGGERHRVYMAICLSFLPKVIMLDEPTAALDAESSRDFFNGVLGYCREAGITCIVVSHDMQLAEQFGEEIIDLGRIKDERSY